MHNYLLFVEQKIVCGYLFFDSGQKNIEKKRPAGAVEHVN